MHVVVVDPSRTVLKAVSRLLAREGHEVSIFLDGPEALAYIKSNPCVSALITSAELTTMSGIELCAQTRPLSGRDRAIYRHAARPIRKAGASAVGGIREQGTTARSGQLRSRHSREAAPPQAF